MLDPEIARKVLSRFGVRDRPSILDAVNLGKNSKLELEMWGLFCACLAWGKLETKRRKLISFHEKLSTSFIEFLEEPLQEPLRIIYPGNGSLQLLGLCLAIRDILEEYGSAGEIVKRSESVNEGIFKLANTLRKKLDQHPPSTRKFNLPRVASKPPVTIREKKRTRALKRYCMYMRWMVRNSEPDFGIWKFYDKRDLFHPVDTHVACILKRWRVLSNEKDDWLNVEKVTEYFRIIEHNDPLKFDYHLVTFGQKFCEKKDPKCWKCSIKSQFNCNL